MIKQAYYQGFARKCAEHGVDPVMLIEKQARNLDWGSISEAAKPVTQWIGRHGRAIGDWLSGAFRKTVSPAASVVDMPPTPRALPDDVLEAATSSRGYVSDLSPTLQEDFLARTTPVRYPVYRRGSVPDVAEDVDVPPAGHASLPRSQAARAMGLYRSDFEKALDDAELEMEIAAAHRAPIRKTDSGLVDETSRVIGISDPLPPDANAGRAIRERLRAAGLAQEKLRSEWGAKADFEADPSFVPIKPEDTVDGFPAVLDGHVFRSPEEYARALRIYEAFGWSPR